MKTAPAGQTGGGGFRSGCNAVPTLAYVHSARGVPMPGREWKTVDYGCGGRVDPRRGGRRRVAGAVWAFLCFSFLYAAPSLVGQTLRGRVVDAGSGEPVTLSFVALMEDGREMVVSTLGDDDGKFSLTAPRSGSYFLYVARAGYATVVDGMFELGAEGELDLQVGMRADPITLAPLLVEAETSPSALDRSGFYDRAALGRGTYLLREEIQRRAPNLLTDAFTAIPRLQVVRSKPLIGLDAVLNPEVLILRGSEYCAPTLYLDGTPVVFGSRSDRRGRAVRPDDYADPADVEAVEIYTRQSEIPLSVPAVGDCGVIMIWTRMR